MVSDKRGDGSGSSFPALQSSQQEKTADSTNPGKQGQLGTRAEPPSAALAGWREFPSDAVENNWTLGNWTAVNSPEKAWWHLHELGHDG